MHQFAPSDIRQTDEPAIAGNVIELPWLPVMFPAGLLYLSTIVLPASPDDVITCALGDVERKMNMLPGDVETAGSVIVSTPCDAEITVTPASLPPNVADAVRVFDCTAEIEPSKPLPGTMITPRSVIRVLTMSISIVAFRKTR